jgi:hypothetical protein
VNPQRKNLMADFSSRSARIPPRHHKRSFAISKHAIDRFRERVDEEFRHRDDDDLGNLLDERVRHAESNYQVRDPRAPDEITTLRSVACKHATYWAVIRDQTVVTVLDEEMARNNFQGQWAVVLNTPFAALRDLKLSVAPPAASVPKPVPAPAPEVPADPLAEAGVAYARARKRKHACAENVARLQAELERADVELRDAMLAVEEARRHLDDLTGGE